MARASTATLIGSLSALLFSACSSGDDGMNPAPMAPPITQGGSGGTIQAPPNNNLGTAGKGGSTAPVPTAGTTTPARGYGQRAMPTAGTEAPPPQCMNCAIPPRVPGLPARGHQVQPGRHRAAEQVHAVPPDDEQPVRGALHRRDARASRPSSRATSTASCRRRPSWACRSACTRRATSTTYWEKIWAGDYSAYTNPPDEWAIEPGGEITQNYRGHATNTEAEELLPHVLPHAHRLAPQHHHDARRRPMPDGWIPKASATRCRACSTPARARSRACSAASSGRTTARRSRSRSRRRTTGLYLTFPANSRSSSTCTTSTSRIRRSSVRAGRTSGASRTRTVQGELVHGPRVRCSCSASASRRARPPTCTTRGTSAADVRLHPRVRPPPLLDPELQRVDRARRRPDRARLSVVRLVRHADLPLRQRREEPAARSRWARPTAPSRA